MLPIPVRLSSIEIQIHASRRLVFQFITAFGSATPGSEASSRVLSSDDGRLLVEFKTPGPSFLGKRKVYRTVEWVTPYEPERVEFEAVEGPLAMRRERLTLEEESGGTRLRYEAKFRVRGWVLGWLLGVLLIRPKLKRMVQEHLEEIKETIEAQTKKS